MTLEILPAASIWILLVHVAATFYMVGLVWFVQRVHYPLFAGVGPEVFASYQAAHLARTGPVVGPAMLLEGATGMVLVALPPPGVPIALPWIGLGLLLAIWMSTWMLQVPRHRELVAGFDTSAHRRLVATNWIRTTAWSMRGVLVLWVVFRTISAGAA